MGRRGPGDRAAQVSRLKMQDLGGEPAGSDIRTVERLLLVRLLLSKVEDVILRCVLRSWRRLVRQKREGIVFLRQLLCIWRCKAKLPRSFARRKRAEQSLGLSNGPPWALAGSDSRSYNNYRRGRARREAQPAAPRRARSL